MRWVYTYLYTIEMHVLDRFLPSIFPFGNYLLSFKQAMISSIYRLPAYCVLKSLPFFFFDPKVINFIHEMGMKKKTFPSIVAQAKMSKRRKEKSKTRKENVESVCFFFHSFYYLFKPLPFSHLMRSMCFSTWYACVPALYQTCVRNIFLFWNDCGCSFCFCCIPMIEVTFWKSQTFPKPQLRHHFVPLNAGIKLKSMTHNIFLRRLSSKFKSKSKSKSKHKFLVGLK